MRFCSSSHKDTAGRREMGSDGSLDSRMGSRSAFEAWCGRTSRGALHQALWVRASDLSVLRLRAAWTRSRREATPRLREADRELSTRRLATPSELPAWRSGASPVSRRPGSRLARRLPIPGLFIQHNVRRQVLALRTQTINDPRANAWPTRNRAACVDHPQGRFVIDMFGPHRADHA